jgi:hypothetical protein
MDALLRTESGNIPQILLAGPFEVFDQLFQFLINWPFSSGDPLVKEQKRGHAMA